MGVPSGKFQALRRSDFLRQLSPKRFPKWSRRRVPAHHNFNVSKILPVTTLRTIDLGGKKNPGPLFSIFCAKESVFFELNSAPECVHRNQIVDVTLEEKLENLRSSSYANDAARI